jgi:Uma2 family endonuclease
MQDVTRVGMSLVDFNSAFTQRPFEMYDGEIVYLIPTVFGPGKIIQRLFVLLYAFIANNRLGEIYQEITFILPDRDDPNWVRGSRVPDLMFYNGTRIADYMQQHPDWYNSPLTLVPDLVVEVVSPTDHYSDVEKKVSAYPADGVRLIWIVDGQTQRVAVQRAGSNQQTNLTITDVLEGEEMLPGLRLPVSDIFEVT